MQKINFSSVRGGQIWLALGGMLLLGLFAAYAPANHNTPAALAERIAPEGSLNIAATAVQTAPAARAPQSAMEVYNGVCAVCHAAGVAGAPRTGDAAAWQTRLAQGGLSALIQNAINGLAGAGGVMPARGGNPNLTDAEVQAAVEYMLEQSK